MSALVIRECNGCAAITTPWPTTAERAREEHAPEGWAVDVDGSNVDYCPQCTPPAGAGTLPSGAKVYGDPLMPVSRLTTARLGIVQLRDALSAIVKAHDATPTLLVSVADLAVVRANALLEELAA